MKAKNQNFIQAYHNSPWRSQVQTVSYFAIALLGFAVIASIYLIVSSKTATIGREIQVLQAQVLDLQQGNADREIRLAQVTSASAMEKRALKMGFIKANANDLFYITVPGYTGRNKIPPNAALSHFDSDSVQLPLEFSQTLLEWLQDFTLSNILVGEGGNP